MLRAIRNLFKRKPKALACYRFPVFIPGSGQSEFAEAWGETYLDARRAVMAAVDTSQFIVGPGVEVTASGETLH